MFPVSWQNWAPIHSLLFVCEGTCQGKLKADDGREVDVCAPTTPDLEDTTDGGPDGAGVGGAGAAAAA